MGVPPSLTAPGIPLPTDGPTAALHAEIICAAPSDVDAPGGPGERKHAPFKRAAILNYLQLPEKDPGHQAALAWLKARHGAQATTKDITEQDRKDFLAHMTDRYYRIVSKAIKKYDPNHCLLGSCFHGAELNYPEVFKAAGAYLDVMAVNYYRMWTPVPEKMQMWAKESGRPILITEWYVKGADAGLANTSGAGWIVKTQQDRGWFYQYFTLGLLESKVCVGGALVQI